MSDSALISFYRGLGRDHAGRTIAEIWAWDHRRLETVHDYIQWLFPLRENSRFNPDAPVLTDADIAAFRADPGLDARVMSSLDLMLDFFGLQRDDGTIVRGHHFRARAPVWLAPTNHNHLRLTRIMISLGLVGRTAEARALYDCLVDIAGREGRSVVPERTLAFWRDAVAFKRDAVGPAR